jgi:hypothetical protein
MIILHSPVLVTKDEVVRLKAELHLMSMMITTGIVSQPNALEMLAIKVIHANADILDLVKEAEDGTIDGTLQKD